jgi:hypothetical protein
LCLSASYICDGKPPPEYGAATGGSRGAKGWGHAPQTGCEKNVGAYLLNLLRQSKIKLEIDAHINPKMLKNAHTSIIIIIIIQTFIQRKLE